jgi:UDP-GlcNAc:undecaprenyl-phosphate GlcNAc-1-phosphate transferase
VLGLMLSALLCSALLTAVSIPLGEQMGFIDEPAPLKIHAKVTSRLGGLGIFAGFVVGTLLTHSNFQALLAGGAVIFAVGLLDDRANIKPVQKLIGQALAGIVLAYIGFNSHSGAIAIVYGVLGFILVMFFSNALNLIDGMNGLAAGTACLTFVSIAAIQLLHHIDMRISWICAAAVLGFLPLNFPKARVFMGDSGSLLVGYLVAYALLTLSVIDAALLVAGLIAAGIPIFDLVLGVVRRIISGAALFSGDRGHFYDRLNGLVSNDALTVLIVFVVAIGLGVVAVWVSQWGLLAVTLAAIILGALLTLLSISMGWLRSGLGGA